MADPHEAEEKGLIDLNESRLSPRAETWLSGRRARQERGAYISTILATAAIVALVHIRERIDAPTGARPLHPDSPQVVILLAFAYLAVLSNCISAVFCFFISDKLLTVPFCVPQGSRDSVSRQDKLSKGFSRLLLGKVWPFSEHYWLLHLSLGFFCIFAEFNLYAVLFETQLAVKVVVVIFSLNGVLPLAAYWISVVLSLSKENEASYMLLPHSYDG